MKNLFSLVFLLFAIFSISKAQVVITPSLIPSYYVQNVLMGNYVGISNVFIIVFKGKFFKKQIDKTNFILDENKLLG